MIFGRYRDSVKDHRGRDVFDTDWRRNTIARGAWLLIGGLLKNEAALNGILYWAVGVGDSAWDGVRVAADPATTRLHDEVSRVPVPISDIRYVDAAGLPVSAPSTHLEVRASFTWSGEDRTLREFGLFGGDASAAADTGYLINYVIHPRIDLPAQTTLDRQLRLGLAASPAQRWLELPSHWLSARATTLLDGVGTSYATALEGIGITTLAELAAAEPALLGGVLPQIKAVELRARARLTLRTAAHVRASSGLHARTAWDVLITPTATLAADANVSEEEAARVREQVSVLELTLDHRFLRRITVGELMGG